MDTENELEEFKIYRGDSIDIPLHFQDDNGVAYDITNWTIYFTVRKQYAITSVSTDVLSNGAVIAKNVTIHSNPSTGDTIISLSKNDTNLEPRTYRYDIQIKGGTFQPRTLGTGKFTILPDETRSS